MPEAHFPVGGGGGGGGVGWGKVFLSFPRG